MGNLPYVVARALDDFLEGMGVEGDVFWVRPVGEPRIDERHKTNLPVQVAIEDAHGLLTPISSGTLKAYPSTLADLDARMRIEDLGTNMWYCVHVEREGKGRRYRIYDERPRAVPIEVPPPSTPPASFSPSPSPTPSAAAPSTAAAGGPTCACDPRGATRIEVEGVGLVCVTCRRRVVL